MRRSWSLLLPFVLALVVGGCKVTSINYFPPHPAQVRVANLLPGVASVDVLVGGTVLWSGVTSQSVTSYQILENTTQNFVVNVAGTTTQLAQGSFVLAGEQPYTFVITGTPSQPTVNFLQEVKNPPTNGSVLISAFNAASNVSSLDLYATIPGADITVIGPTYFGLKYNGTTYNVSFQPGTYQVRATVAGTKTVIYDSGPITVVANTALFFVTYSAGSSRLVNAGLLQSQGPAQALNSLFTQVKTVHAAPQTGAIDLLESGVPVISNVAYTGFGGYNTAAPAAAQVMSFTGTGTLAPTLASVTAALSSATDQTVFITGFPGSLQAVYLADLNVVAAPGGVRVRFVNTSPDAGPITVTVASTPPTVVTGIASPTASGYATFAAGTYSITVTSTASGATLLTLPNVVFTTPQTSSVYMIGPASGIGGFITQDF